MAKRRPKNNNVKNSRISNYVPGESNDLASSINRLIQVLEDNGRKPGGGGNKEEKESSAASRSKKLLNKLGLGKVNDLAETFIGKKQVQSFHNKLGEKLFGKGALGKGAKGLASLGGGLMRFAGPIGLIAGLGKMNYYKFLSANIFGALLWGAGITTLGYYAASIPALDGSSKQIAGFFIVLTILITLKNYLRSKRK